ncbi:MAG TPA: aminotransferase class III-fold pyridoxal phosphate-dependent enzyme [Solirubrobacteraceae bacterium]|nr:aminotransferase class III-fold pyridoxal phosphate-dependent enzyme [Solirubrobacteraceae bacterium]
MDRVLTVEPPRLVPADALEVARTCFGLAAAQARDLGSERDRAFALEDPDGRPLAVMKVSNPSEDPEVLDMEAEAALHVQRVDPGLRVAVPWRSARSGDPGPARPADRLETLRAPWRDGGRSHWVRLYDVLPGHSRIEAGRLSDPALSAWGETTARLAQALQGFTHARARRAMLWDVQHALAAREMIDDIRDPRRRRLVVDVLDEFERRVAPAWPRLRAQVVHTDLTVDNALTDDDGFITGIIDFGDMSFTALITDLASVLDSLGVGRPGSELLRLARLVLDGYQRRIELQEQELSVLGVMWAARSALTIAISSWRVAQGLEDLEFAERYNGECARMIEALAEVGWDQVARELGARTPAPAGAAKLVARRAAVFGPTMEPLFYDDPVEVASAEGVWITDVQGRRYLDAYNNVPCVGHAHPRVNAAIARQSRRINTHMRYLHPAAIELAERLAALCPPELDTVLLVNSGSEANDVAWRIATALTGRSGGLCTAFAYHGITEATAALSPEGWFDTAPPPHVETWEPPDSFRGTGLGPDSFTAALERLRQRGIAPAAAILDGLITSDRIDELDPGYVQELVALTRAAGALWIADEVQAGHGRTGSMWCFERFGVVPDFVTLGKPMGNGHPVAAVITRRELVSELAGHTTLFSTFGGNPVSAAAALAVLDVLEDERMLERVRETDSAIRVTLGQLAERHEAVGDVRGVGLAWGVEVVSDPVGTPDAQRAVALREALRRRGVLVGTTGRDRNILKIRPPLAFGPGHATMLAERLDAALSGAAGGLAGERGSGHRHLRMSGG